MLLIVTKCSIGLLDFKVLPRVTSWLNVAGLVCAGLLLVTYFILPVEKTSRHYLTVGLVVAVCTLQVRSLKGKRLPGAMLNKSIRSASLYPSAPNRINAMIL